VVIIVASSAEAVEGELAALYGHPRRAVSIVAAPIAMKTRTSAG
jgi:hypothetical protein